MLRQDHLHVEAGSTLQETRKYCAVCLTASSVAHIASAEVCLWRENRTNAFKLLKVIEGDQILQSKTKLARKQILEE